MSVAALLLSVTFSACGSAPAVSATVENSAVPVCVVDPGLAAAVPRVDHVVEALRRAQHIPGLTVAVCWQGDELVRAYGTADLENDVPATAETVYRLASISKPITAVALMQLVESGSIDLDADIATYVPSFSDKRWVTTPRLLLSHLGGVRHYMRSRETQLNRHFEDVEAALSTFDGDPLLHEPGSRYLYTTFGYNLLGAAVQRVAGRRFDEVLREKVFAPAGAHSLQLDDAWKIIPHRAQGYRLRRDEIVNAFPVDTSNKVPGGGLCGTALDVARFGRAMLDDVLVTRSTREQMWTPAVDGNGESVGYGFGFSVKRDATGALVVGHGGSQPRVQTMLRIWPDRDLVVALMCNLQGAKLSLSVDAIAEAVVGG